MKWMGWTLVCKHNKDGVVLRWCYNINTTEVEYTNTNKMSTHNILLLQLISSLYPTHHIEMVRLLFFLIELCSLIFLEVQWHSPEAHPPLQVQLLTCYILFGSVSLSLFISLSFSVLIKFEPIFMRWRLFLRIALSLSFNKV